MRTREEKRSEFVPIWIRTSAMMASLFIVFSPSPSIVHFQNQPEQKVPEIKTNGFIQIIDRHHRLLIADRHLRNHRQKSNLKIIFNKQKQRKKTHHIPSPQQNNSQQNKMISSVPVWFETDITQFYQPPKTNFVKSSSFMLVPCSVVESLLSLR